MLDRDTFSDARVIQLSEQFVPVKIDADKDRSTARKFRVHSYPTIIFADKSGRPVARIRGFEEPKPFAMRLQEIARVHRELPQMQAKFESSPDDLANAGSLAAAYAARGKIGKAKKAMKVVEAADPNNEQGYLTEAYMSAGDYYIDKDKPRDAADYYIKAAQTADDTSVVADARLNAAIAHYDCRLRSAPGTSAYLRCLEKAQGEAEAMLKLEDLPGDRKENATKLLEDIAEAKKETR